MIFPLKARFSSVFTEKVKRFQMLVFSVSLSNAWFAATLFLRKSLATRAFLARLKLSRDGTQKMLRISLAVSLFLAAEPLVEEYPGLHQLNDVLNPFISQKEKENGGKDDGLRAVSLSAQG